VFSGAGTVASISHAIGRLWPGHENVHEDDNLLFFCRRGELVDYVLFRGFNYQQEPHFVKFIGHFNAGEVFTPATATFRATRPRRSTFIHLYAPARTASVYRPSYGRYLAQQGQAARVGTSEPVRPDN
jgi:hypothetical protein